MLSPLLLRTVLLWTVFMVLPAGCSSDQDDPAAGASVQTYEALGVVKTITPTRNYVNIDHEAIPGFMDAMAMFFPVPDTAVLNNVAVDDSVMFTIEVKAGKPGISKISVLQ